MPQKSVKKRSLQRTKPVDYMTMIPQITKKGIGNTAEQVTKGELPNTGMVLV
jgi:hypothetical protein